MPLGVYRPVRRWVSLSRARIRLLVGTTGSGATARSSKRHRMSWARRAVRHCKARVGPSARPPRRRAGGPAARHGDAASDRSPSPGRPLPLGPAICRPIWPSGPARRDARDALPVAEGPNCDASIVVDSSDGAHGSLLAKGLTMDFRPRPQQPQCFTCERCPEIRTMLWHLSASVKENSIPLSWHRPTLLAQIRNSQPSGAKDAKIQIV